MPCPRLLPTYRTGRTFGSKQWETFAPFEVVPGSKLNVELERTKGDPDLCVRFDKQPTLNAWDCRPLVRGKPGHERCELQVPQGAMTAHLRVRGHGHKTSQFDLKATMQARPVATIHPIATAVVRSFAVLLDRCQPRDALGFLAEIEPAFAFS